MSSEDPIYVLCPGFVVSMRDGQRHFITARQLAELYGVPMEKCLVKPSFDDPRLEYWRAPENAIELYPKYSGVYSLPSETTHDLYATGDKDAPEIIKDRNGEVVLGLCKACGKAEVELLDPLCSRNHGQS